MVRASFTLALVVLTAGVLTFAWWWPARPRAGGIAMPDAVFNSVSFAPFRPGQSPLSETYPSAAEVASDLAVVAGRSRAIRTYAALEGDYDIPALAARQGLKVWQGIWLGPDRARNAREIARGVALARAHPATVERVIVGNEVLLRRDLPVAELIAAIDQVRASVPQKVSYADVWEFWRAFPEIAGHVDLVTIHLLPYWEDEPTGIDGAVRHVASVYNTIAALFPGKPVAIGETGWPSRGRWRQGAAPGRVEQAVFLRRFVALARAEGFDYNLIEAFDQDWKYTSEGTVGANWGLWTADRRPKFPASGPISPDPAWPAEAAASLAAGLALFAAARPRLPRPAPRAEAGLAVLAMALGGALVFAWTGTVPLIYDRHLLVATVVNLAGQGWLAGLTMALAADRLAGRPAPPPRSFAQATGRVRLWLRLAVRPDRWRRARVPGWIDPMPLDDLLFLFVWAAAVMQLLLLFDPRYRDFPLPSFAVPLVTVLARAALGDLPRGGGGWEEAWAGGTLAAAAIASAIAEGPGNRPALAWTATALALAAPALRRALPNLTRPGLVVHRRATPTPRAPRPACPRSRCS